HPVLDRLLDRDDFAVGFVDAIEAGIERARLAGAGRPRHEQNPIRQAKQSLEPPLIVAEKSKVREAQHQIGSIENAHDDAFAMVRGDRRNSEVDRLPLYSQLHTPILRPTLFSDPPSARHALY